MIFRDWHDALPERRRLRRAGLRLVFANGCFDLLHPGHLRLLERARGLGDRLLVAINTDRGVRANKGPGRPIVNERERAELLDALAAVDYVTFFDEPTPQAIVAALRPDVLVKGADWGTDEIVGRREVEASGGRVVRASLEPGYSTSAIIAAVQKGRRLRPGVRLQKPAGARGRGATGARCQAGGVRRRP